MVSFCLWDCKLQNCVVFFTTKTLFLSVIFWAFFYKCFDVYCLHKFSKYIPYKLSIEKQRSVVDAWGLDLRNDI